MKLGYLFVSYPGASQSFLHREITGLVQQGFAIEIHALLQTGKPTPQSVPVGATLHPFSKWHWLKLVPLLLYYLLTRPRLFLQGGQLLWTYPPRTAEHWRQTLLGVVFALVKVAHFRQSGIQHFHGAWATAPATAAAILGSLLDRPFSFGAQAYDIYRSGGDPFLVPKLRAARWIHTTTQKNVLYLTEKCPEAMAKIHLIRRGLDHLPTVTVKPLTGRPLRLLSVARLVPKKGHRWQLEACALLRNQGLPFTLRWVGDGPLSEELNKEVHRLSLQDHITLCGALPPEEVQKMYEWADLFWHTGIVDSEGDRDGLPNVVPEAMSYGIPVISSQEGAVTEAVIHQQTGWIVDVTQPQQLAAATTFLSHEEEICHRLSRRGRKWVEENFLSATNSHKMAQAFQRITAA